MKLRTFPFSPNTRYDRDMDKYTVFLRAINVGRHTVKMDRLRELFKTMGFSNVETFIASGNIIFESTSKDATRLEKMIEKKLKDALGFEVATFIRSDSELNKSR